MNALSVRVGSSKHASGGSAIKVKSLVMHPKYNNIRVDYDFSLLELEKPLTFTDKIQSIILPDENSAVPDGKLCEISGWGMETHELINVR